MSSVGMEEIVIADGKEFVVGRRNNLNPKSIARSSRGGLAEFTIADVNRDISQEEVLFDAKAGLKVAVSKISMHLPSEWRSSVFKQIDILHNLEDWDDESDLIVAPAFSTFLRFIVFAKPPKVPSLAISPGGNPVASWFFEDQRVYIEFQAKDVANAVLAKDTDRGPEAISWRGPVTNIKTAVANFGCSMALGW